MGRKKVVREDTVITHCQQEQVATDGKRQCQGCGICVGADFIERQSYQVGDYQICGRCLLDLKCRGKLQVEPYIQHLFLHPDGHISVEKISVKKVLGPNQQSDVEEEEED